MRHLPCNLSPCFFSVGEACVLDPVSRAGGDSILTSFPGGDIVSRNQCLRVSLLPLTCLDGSVFA